MNISEIIVTFENVPFPILYSPAYLSLINQTDTSCPKNSVFVGFLLHDGLNDGNFVGCMVGIFDGVCTLFWEGTVGWVEGDIVDIYLVIM